MTSAPLLALERVSKVYRRGLLDRTPAFQLDVDHAFAEARDRRRHGTQRRRQDHAV